MRPPSTPVAALLLALGGCASADTTATETVGGFLLSMPARNTDAVIAFCSASVPGLGGELMEERAAFVGKLDAAKMSLMASLGDEPGFNAPVRESMRREIAGAEARALDLLRQRDPELTCRAALENIRNATVEELRMVLEASYREFRAAGQTGKPG